jgi:all-trans-retinol 13,14-reductase
MIVGKPLRDIKLDNHYDVIIIGSGIGGLSCATFLAQKGKKVLVLEKHYTIGGFTHTFSRKGYEWDVGVHYIGEVSDEWRVIARLFNRITDGKLKWQDMGPVYDKIVFPDKTYDFVKGKDNFRKKLKEYFPEEKVAIDKYIETVQEAVKSGGLYFLGKTMPSWLTPLFSKKYKKFYEKTTYEVLSSITKNEKLIGVLTGQWGDYGLPPKESSFVMHASVAKHYFAGGNYPIGGSSMIAKTIVDEIEKNGGTVAHRAGVKEILTKDDRAYGVLLENGTTVMGDKIVSGAGIYNTWDKLLPKKVASKYGWKEKAQEIKPSAAHICVYLGLKGSAKELGITTPNLWIYPSYDHDKNVKSYLGDKWGGFPLVYISFPSAKDPAWDKNHPNKSTVEILTLAPYEWFEKWQDTKWKKRGEEYDNLKKELSDRLLECLFKEMPQLREHVDYFELSTPLSTQFFSNYDRGEIYGLDHDTKRFNFPWGKPTTPIKNLYLTGQDVVSGGVGGALAGGAITTISMLGLFKAWDVINLLRPLKKK